MRNNQAALRSFSYSWQFIWRGHVIAGHLVQLLYFRRGLVLHHLSTSHVVVTRIEVLILQQYLH